MRSKIVPVIIGILRTIKKGLDQNLQLVPGLLSVTELQRSYQCAQQTSFIKCWDKLLVSLVEILTYQNTLT